MAVRKNIKNGKSKRRNIHHVEGAVYYCSVVLAIDQGTPKTQFARQRAIICHGVLSLVLAEQYVL